MNRLLEFTALRNRYYALRHGQSIANQQGIIVSHPDNGLNGYGLSDQGVAQVERGTAGAGLDPETRIVSSDFSRALESARIAHRVLGCNRPFFTDTRLRERFFGQLELGTDSAYADVWEIDAVDPDSEQGGMESANRVMARVTELVRDLEGRLSGATVLLVSHGDALQILQTAFFKKDASEHRRLEHLDTAEIRELKLARNPS